MLAALVAAGVIAAFGSLVAVLLLVSIGINLVSRVPYAATPRATIERIFDSLHLRAGQRVYDLGCGDGRVVFAASRRGAHATGFEIQPLTFGRAKWTQWRHCPAAEIRFGSFRRASVQDADVVFCFLVAAVMPEVATWLRAQLRPTATVISYGFALPGWRATEVLAADHPGGSQTFIYHRPRNSPSG